MVSSLFREQGWEVLSLGANLPLEYALSSAKRWQPHLPHLRTYVEQLERLADQPTIMVGGRLAARYDLSNYCSPQTLVLEDLLQVERWLRADQLLNWRGEEHRASS